MIVVPAVYAWFTNDAALSPSSKFAMAILLACGVGLLGCGIGALWIYFVRDQRNEDKSRKARELDLAASAVDAIAPLTATIAKLVDRVNAEPPAIAAALIDPQPEKHRDEAWHTAWMLMERKVNELFQRSLGNTAQAMRLADESEQKDNAGLRLASDLDHLLLDEAVTPESKRDVALRRIAEYRTQRLDVRTRLVQLPQGYLTFSPDIHQRLSEYVESGEPLLALAASDHSIPAWLTDVGMFLETRCNHGQAVAFRDAAPLEEKFAVLQSIRDWYDPKGVIPPSVDPPPVRSSRGPAV